MGNGTIAALSIGAVVILGSAVAVVVVLKNKKNAAGLAANTPPPPPPSGGAVPQIQPAQPPGGVGANLQQLGGGVQNVVNDVSRVFTDVTAGVNTLVNFGNQISAMFNPNSLSW